MTGQSLGGYRIPFAGVGYQYSDEDKKVVSEAMSSTSTFTQGAYQAQFESKFAEFIGVESCFATSSAATALELAAVLLDLEPGDEVICPAHTYCASAYPFARHGVKMRWADIDPDTFVVCPSSVESLVSERTRAILAVHLYGLPADLTRLRSIADRAGVVLIEDCAQSIGATYASKPTGSFGDLAAFSFQSHKNISTLGEGGMLVVNDPKMAAHIPSLRHNGHRPFNRTDSRYWHPAMSDVAFTMEGVWPHNFCLGEPQAALGAHLLDRVDAINAKRRQRHLMMRDALSDFDEIVFQFIPDETVSAHHLNPFRYDGQQFEACNHDFMERLVAEHKVQPATQYYPLYRYELFSLSGNGDADVPNTDRFFDNMVSVPFHVWMTDSDFDSLVEAVRETAMHLRRHGGAWFHKGTY